MTRLLGGVLSHPLGLAAIAASAGAGLIHLAHGPAHLDELGALGAGFYLAAALQLGWAAVVLAALAGSGSGWSRRGVAPLARSGIAINGAILAAWVISRTVGLPAGATPWTPEAIGLPDATSAILQGLLVVGLAATLRGWRMPRLPRAHALATAGSVVAILLIATGTAVAISPSEVGHSHAPGNEHAVTDTPLVTETRVVTDEHVVTEEVVVSDEHSVSDEPVVTDEPVVADEDAHDDEHAEHSHAESNDEGAAAGS